MSKDILHVVPHDESWAVKREGNERASSTHNTQKDAIDAARGLAHEGDDIVIHRPDGTIREKVTYTGNGTANPTTEERNGTVTPSRVRASDVMSVGTRVSWGAVLAGAVVALATYFTLNLLAFAIGISTFNQMNSETIGLTAGIVSTFCLMVALFMGGFVASSTTVGEEKSEAMVYGVLLWATLLVLLLSTGFGLGVGYFAGVRDFVSVDRPVVNVTPTEADAQVIVNENLRQSIKANSPALAWWTFGGVALALFASVAGALVGAGPEMILRRVKGRRVVAVPVR